MYRTYRTLFLLILPLLAFLSCTNDPEDTQVLNYVTVNDPVPNFTVSDGRDGTFQTEQLQGKRSLIFFFYTLCGDCQRELPKIETVWQELKDDPNYCIVPIAREQGLKETDDYWTKNGYTMPKYLDPNRAVYSRFANMQVPRLYLVDSKGVIQWMEIERITLTPQEIINKLKALE